MSTKNNIALLGFTLRDIQRESAIHIDTLSQALPAMLKQENFILDLNEFSPESREVVKAMFGDFSRQLWDLAVLLRRFTVDEEEDTLTIIGHDNVMNF